MIKRKRDAKQTLHFTKWHVLDNETWIEYFESPLVGDGPCNTREKLQKRPARVITALATVIILDAKGAGAVKFLQFQISRGDLAIHRDFKAKYIST